MDATQRRWRQDFANSAAAIPTEWLVTVEDGSRWILPQYANNLAVRLHLKLAQVGYAHGWMR